MRNYRRGDVVLYTTSLLLNNWNTGEYIQGQEDAHEVAYHQVKSDEGTFYYPDSHVMYPEKFRMWNTGDRVEVSIDKNTWFPAIFKEHDYEDFLDAGNDPEKYSECSNPYRVMGKEIHKHLELNNLTHSLWFPYCRDRK